MLPNPKPRIGQQTILSWQPAKSPIKRIHSNAKNRHSYLAKIVRPGNVLRIKNRQVLNPKRMSHKCRSMLTSKVSTLRRKEAVTCCTSPKSTTFRIPRRWSKWIARQTTARSSKPYQVWELVSCINRWVQCRHRWQSLLFLQSSMSKLKWRIQRHG